MPIDAYEDDEEEQEGPKSSFATYLAEGDTLFKQSEFKKALDSYSLALELQPNDKTCLVARSKCHLKLGDPQKALVDAEAALTEDKEYNKGLYRKAEALYCMGDFEYALMYYHRGHKLRPELDEFRLGIQKAQEAIDNSIGSTAKIKLENKGDLSFFTKHDDLGNKKHFGKPLRNTMKIKPVMGNRNKEVKQPAPSKKTVKQLLGELYADKEYLEKLMDDTDFIQNNINKPIYELVQSGINYLDTRTEFWRQQKPLYARKRETSKSSASKAKKVKPSMAKYVLKELEEIDQALISGNPDRSLKLAQQLLKKVDDSTLHDLPNKNDVLSNIHSCIGNAFVELNLLNKALKHHQKDLEMSKKSQSKEGISRALDNIGRVYARLGKFEKAVKSWTEKLPLVKTPLESTWLSHEIGRCYLELTEYTKAEEFGEKSFEAGEECGDEVWQLNALVLAAQAQAKLGKLKSALKSFNKAYEIAVTLDDDSAQTAITKATEEVQRKIEEDTGQDFDIPIADADGVQSEAEDKPNASANVSHAESGDESDANARMTNEKDDAASEDDDESPPKFDQQKDIENQNAQTTDDANDDTSVDISTHDEALPSYSEEISHEKLDSFYDTTHTDSDDNASTNDVSNIEDDSKDALNNEYTPIPSDTETTPREEDRSETPTNVDIIENDEKASDSHITDEQTALTETEKSKSENGEVSTQEDLNESNGSSNSHENKESSEDEMIKDINAGENETNLAAESGENPMEKDSSLTVNDNRNADENLQDTIAEDVDTHNGLNTESPTNPIKINEDDQNIEEGSLIQEAQNDEKSNSQGLSHEDAESIHINEGVQNTEDQPLNDDTQNSLEDTQKSLEDTQQSLEDTQKSLEETEEISSSTIEVKQTDKENVHSEIQDQSAESSTPDKAIEENKISQEKNIEDDKVSTTSEKTNNSASETNVNDVEHHVTNTGDSQNDTSLTDNAEGKHTTDSISREGSTLSATKIGVVTGHYENEESSSDTLTADENIVVREKESESPMAANKDISDDVSTNSNDANKSETSDVKDVIDDVTQSRISPVSVTPVTDDGPVSETTVTDNAPVSEPTVTDNAPVSETTVTDNAPVAKEDEKNTETSSETLLESNTNEVDDKKADSSANINKPMHDGTASEIEGDKPETL